MMAGFVHGVLNTDNMNVTGESFDYGPWRFAPTYAPDFTAAYFDHGGMYAFGRQPAAVHWNCVRLAEALLPVTSEAAVRPVLETFEARLAAASGEALGERLGVQSRGAEADAELLTAGLTFWNSTEIPYERLFFDWQGGEVSAARAQASPAASFYDHPTFAPIRALLGEREPADPARLEHPYFAGDPCTMLIDEMEATWTPIAEDDDWSPFDAKVQDIRRMGDALGLTPRPR